MQKLETCSLQLRGAIIRQPWDWWESQRGKSKNVPDGLKKEPAHWNYEWWDNQA